MRLARLLPALLVATGCTSVKTSLKQPPAVLAPGKGVVVFSTGANDTHVIGPVTGLKLETLSPSGEVTIIGTDVNMDNGFTSSQFDDEHGHVRMAVLDGGTHCLFPVSLNAQYRYRDPPSFEFRVKPGTVTYIGSLFLDSGRFVVRYTKWSRDVDAALAAHPELKELPAAVALAAIRAKCSPAR